MNGETGVTVIRPPFEVVTSGKVFRPSRRLRNKYWFTAVVTAATIWAITILTFYGAAYFLRFVDGPDLWSLLEQQWVQMNWWIWVINACWLVPTMIVVQVYVNSIEYSVLGQSGESLPEIYVKKGIINITKKHVPLRTITNIASMAGPFDRLFRIGNVEIETASSSVGAAGTTEPEEKIEGVVFYEELRNYILRELRKLGAPYVTGTEVVQPTKTGYTQERPVALPESATTDEILITLREMRDILQRMDEKLDRRGGR